MMDDAVLDIGRSCKSACLVPEGMSFPATRDQILQHARESHLPPDVLGKLEKLPDKSYDNVADMVGAAATEVEAQSIRSLHRTPDNFEPWTFEP